LEKKDKDIEIIKNVATLISDKGSCYALINPEFAFNEKIKIKLQALENSVKLEEINKQY